MSFNLVDYLDFNTIQNNTANESYARSYTSICRYRDIGTDLFQKDNTKVTSNEDIAKTERQTDEEKE